MPPALALVMYAIGIAMLFRLERDAAARPSPALWIPVAWLWIGASRNVGEWLGTAPSMRSPDQYLEGSPLDALIFAALEAAALAVLIARQPRTGAFLRANAAILLFFLYAAVSVVWSDYPVVALKRWTKAVGNVAMVLVVLTDPEPRAAVKAFLARAGFVLVPLSVLIIKYFPEWGRGFDFWTGRAYNTGVAVDKNGLGVVCLIVGLASLWRCLNALRERPFRRTPLMLHGGMLGMTVWLFSMADSATSLGCFLVGAVLIAVTTWFGSPRPAAVHLLSAGIVFVCVFGLLIDTDAGLVQALGRDATLTTRTLLWNELVRFNVDPIFGTGFESFWLGERARILWAKYWWHPNQAHNGYLEMYLNLGWVGVTLLGLLLVRGYRNTVRTLQEDPERGALWLAFFMAAVLYNLTEAAFKVVHPAWVIFLFTTVAVPAAVPLPLRKPLASAARSRPAPTRGRPGRSLQKENV
jgi:O-antigen ligase